MRLEDEDLASLFELRDVCVSQIAAGLPARELAAVMRQLVHLLTAIEYRRPPDREAWADWFIRRRNARQFQGTEWNEAAWLADNPEPPKPTRREAAASQPEETTE